MERPPPTPDEVRAALGRVVGAPIFAGARRSADLLRYIVEAELKTPGRAIKEQELGAEALGRGAAFDPRYDPIARVEASRLRGRLAQHYAAEGAEDPLRINLPKGGYTPVFGWGPAVTAARAPARWPSATWFAAGLGIAAVIAMAGFVLLGRSPAAPQRTGTFDIALGAPGVLADQVGNSIALSPDGQTLAMHVITADGSSRLFVRRLDELEARALPGTTGASGPFFSPDGVWIGFQAGNRLRKTRADGSGSPITLVESPDSLGASWSDKGVIIVSLGPRSAFFALPEDGGDPRSIVAVPREDPDMVWPVALPDGHGILFTAIERRQGRYRIEVMRMDGSARRVIAASGTYPRYAAGHVFYVDRGTLFALPFDPARLEPTGEPRPLVNNVAYRDGFGYAFYDVSDTGDLVYLRGSGSLSTINWLDGGDASRPLISTPGRYLFPRVSPDGRKLAYAIAEGPAQVMQVRDLGAGSTITLGKDDTSETFPVWSADSRRIFFQREKDISLGWRNADGSGEAHTLLPGINAPRSLSSKGDRIAFHHLGEPTHFDIWTASVRETPDGPAIGEPEVFLATPAIETYPALSPDGRWIVYTSNEGGDFELFVSPFPVGGQKAKLAAAGRVAVWSPVKQEIFFATNDHRLMVQSYTVRDGAFIPGEARQWSTHQLADTGVYFNFDIAPDGRSIVALLPSTPESARARDHVTLNFNVLAAGK